MFLQFCPEINHLGCPCSCPNPGCLCCWTLPWTCPRWSWRSGNTLNQPSFSSQTAFANTTLPRNQSLGLSLLSSYFWLSLVLDLFLDLTQMVLEVWKHLKPTHFFHSQQPLLIQLCPEINSLGCPCSRPTPGSLWCLDLTQMVLAVRIR